MDRHPCTVVAIVMLAVCACTGSGSAVLVESPDDPVSRPTAARPPATATSSAPTLASGTTPPVDSNEEPMTTAPAPSATPEPTTTSEPTATSEPATQEPTAPPEPTSEPAPPEPTATSEPAPPEPTAPPEPAVGQPPEPRATPEPEPTELLEPTEPAQPEPTSTPVPIGRLPCQLGAVEIEDRCYLLYGNQDLITTTFGTPRYRCPEQAPVLIEDLCYARAGRQPAPRPFVNCTEARLAGRAGDILIGDPDYASHLDADDDGIACEE